MTSTSATRTLIARTLASGLIALTVLSAPAPALAWGNGSARSGDGFGTHDWVLTEANRLAASQGATWVKTSVALPATDDPDTRFKDFSAHVYDRWGKHNGTADKKVAAYYSQAVSYLAAGNTDAASRSLGRLSHYFADINNPLNTDNLTAENRIHARYDSAVDVRTNTVGENRGWITYDGYQHVTSASALTVSSARSAHLSYRTLVQEYNRHRYNRTVNTITSRSLNRSTNRLADIIVSIQEDAALVRSSPQVSAHQGVATDGFDYWVINTTEIKRYNWDWDSIATTSTSPFADPDGQIHAGFTSQMHLGASVFWAEKLYVPAENWPTVSNQHIFVFNARTLERERAVETTLGHEVAAIAVVPEENALYVASFLDSSKLFKYDLDTLSFEETMTLSPAPPVGIQGLTYRDGTFFIAVGSAQNVGRIYTADRATGRTRLIYTSTLLGWHEGIAWRGTNLLWLVDHGISDSRVRYFKLPGF